MSKNTLEQASETKVSGGEAAAAQRAQIEVDDSRAITCYANFCRVTGTPEELILDFALNPTPMMAQENSPPVEIKQRLVLNYFTAKRMLQALHMSVARHEQAFGALETDVSKRIAGMAAARSGK